jgi:tetratricopeptide (TPR) repeat protein
VEIIEGVDTAERYRRTGYPGYYSEYSGLTYLSRSLAGLDHELSDLPFADGYLSRRLADSKGMLVWDMLSRAIGRDRFSRFLKNFLHEHAFQLVSWEEFLKATEEASGIDLKWFYEQWFDRKGAPDWQLNWAQNGRMLRGTITQAAPYYSATLEIQAVGQGSAGLVKTIDIRGAKTDFTWNVEFKVESVELDPHFVLLRWTPAYRTEANALLPYTKADLKLQQGKLDEAVIEFKAALDRVTDPDQPGLRFMLEYGLAESLIQQEKFQEAKPHILAALKGPARRTDILPWVYLQLATVSRHLKDQQTFEWAVKAVVTADAAAGGNTGAVEAASALSIRQQ